MSELNDQLYEKEKELENIGRMKITNVKTDRDYQYNREKEKEYYACEREVNRLKSEIKTQEWDYDNKKSQIEWEIRRIR